MNCLGGTPLETSTYQRPAVGPMTASSEDAGHRQPDVDALLRADDRVERQRERGHELEESLTEELALGEREAVADDPGDHGTRDVGRVRERAGT